MSARSGSDLTEDMSGATCARLAAAVAAAAADTAGGGGGVAPLGRFSPSDTLSARREKSNFLLEEARASDGRGCVRRESPESAK